MVVAAPSGTGKTTVCRELVRGDAGLVFSVSHTTRDPRAGERDGHDYHFVTRNEFARLRDSGSFLEYAEYSGNLYGTAWPALDAQLAVGSDVLLEIETQGARQVRERGVGAFLVFLLPPSLEALEARLRGRGTDDEEEVRRRLGIAEWEFRQARLFDAFVINREVDQTVGEVMGVVERLRAGDPEGAREGWSLVACKRELAAPLNTWIEEASGEADAAGARAARGNAPPGRVL